MINHSNTLIDAGQLQRYTKLDHTIHHLLQDIDTALREHRVRCPTQSKCSIVLYNNLKDTSGFFSPKRYKPAAEVGVDYVLHDRNHEWFTGITFFSTLIDILSYAGYSLQSEGYVSPQYDKAYKLTISW